MAAGGDDWERWLRLLQEAIDQGDTDRAGPAWAEISARVRELAIVLLGQYEVWSMDPDDVTQEVMLRLFSTGALRRMRASGSPDGYLWVVTKNRVLDEVRRSRSWSRLPEARDGTPFDALTGELPTDLQIWLEEVLAELTEDELTLLQLRFWEDQSISDIAARLGLSYSAASVRLFRLLGKLRRRLKS